jgi:hypothetical protein
MLGPDATHSAGTVLAITPNDATVLQEGVRFLYIGGHGGGGGKADVSVVTAGGQTVIFKNVPIGSLLPVQCVRVRATDTTATDILALI